MSIAAIEYDQFKAVWLLMQIGRRPEISANGDVRIFIEYKHDRCLGSGEHRWNGGLIRTYDGCTATCSVCGISFDDALGWTLP